jgi:hypothetical protein
MALATMADSDWNPEPGLLERIERGEDVESMRQEAVVPVRGVASDMLESLVGWLKGFRRDSLVAERERVWIPVAELWPPPGGAAYLTYHTAASREANAQLTVLAEQGFGSAGTLNISQTVEMDTSGPGRRFSIGAFFTIWRYVNEKSGDAFDRVDVVTDDATFQFRTEDIPPEQFPTGTNPITRADLTSNGYEIQGVYELADSASGGVDTYGKSVSKEHSWGVELTIPGLDLLQSTIKLGLKTTRSESFDVSFKLPRGHDYVFFHRIAEDPLVPYCAQLDALGNSL